MAESVLVVGSGGREHALAWKLSTSPRVSRVIVAPGNDGMDPRWERWEADLSVGRKEFVRLAKKGREEKIALAVIGPDNALADGIVDAFEAVGVPCFGPSAQAARIEASKAFAKDVMRAAGVPTARFEVVGSVQEGRKFLESVDWGSGWVVKADGLAFGKGVRVCAEKNEALQAVEELIGVSGKLVIEERLSGEEISWLGFCDGKRAALLEPARDFKRLGDRDQGPNTGGMGAFSPVPGVSAELAERVRREVFMPTLDEMANREAPFRGVLYAGLMVDFKTGKYWVLEFNSRFGDPETQVLLPRMDADLFEWCLAVARGDLKALPEQVPFKKEAAVVVVGAARGYPEKPEKGARIEGTAVTSIRELPECFFAGVKKGASGDLMTAGGRVLGAVALGATVGQARQNAYARIRKIRFEGMHYRNDIAGGVE